MSGLEHLDLEPIGSDEMPAGVSYTFAGANGVHASLVSFAEHEGFVELHVWKERPGGDSDHRELAIRCESLAELNEISRALEMLVKSAVKLGEELSA